MLKRVEVIFGICCINLLAWLKLQFSRNPSIKRGQWNIAWICTGISYNDQVQTEKASVDSCILHASFQSRFLCPEWFCVSIFVLVSCPPRLPSFSFLLFNQFQLRCFWKSCECGFPPVYPGHSRQLECRFVLLRRRLLL